MFSRAPARHHFAVPSVPASPRETSFCCCRFGTKKQKDIFRAEAQRRGENKYRGALRAKRPTAILKVSLRFSRAPARHHFAVPSVPASPRETSFCCCRFGTKKQKDIFRAEAQRRGERQEICGRFAPKESNYRFFRCRLRTPVRPIIAFSSSQRPGASARECFFSCRCARSAPHYLAVLSVPASPCEKYFQEGKTLMKNETAIRIDMCLPVRIRKRGRLYISGCPVLDVWSQGETRTAST